MGDIFPSTLYHYCSINTFYNIIKNKSIWLSDIKKSNDSMELLALRKLMTEEINAKFSAFFKNQSSYNNIDEFDRIMSLHTASNNVIMSVPCDTYVFCLSAEDDLLSQWRGYADDGKGVAIGFKRSFLEKMEDSNELSQRNNKQITFEFSEVLYDEEDARDYIRNHTAISDFDKCKTRDDIKTCIVKALTDISIMAPSYKNFAFHEEREWRLILTLIWDNEDIHDLSFCSTDHMKFGKKAYEVVRNRLISHFALGFSNVTDAISEIVIGPKCIESVEDIRDFLMCENVIQPNNRKLIDIRLSEASYR